MTFAMIVVAAAGLALSNAAGIVARGVESRYAVQLNDSAGMPKALAKLRKTPGVTRAEPVPEAEMRQTLERWLGPGGIGDELPIPALINVDLTTGANVAAIEGQLERTVPGARLVAHQEVVAPLLKSLRVLQWLALTLVLLMAAATSAAVVLAARGAFDTHRSTIEVMHGLGATDEQVTHMFQRKIALDALIGAAAGGLAAGLVRLVLGGGAAALAGDIAGGPPLTASDLILLTMLPIAAVLVAAVVGRMAVLAALRKTL
jgi:cell division transport system permease protein